MSVGSIFNTFPRDTKSVFGVPHFTSSVTTDLSQVNGRVDALETLLAFDAVGGTQRNRFLRITEDGTQTYWSDLVTTNLPHPVQVINEPHPISLSNPTSSVTLRMQIEPAPDFEENLVPMQSGYVLSVQVASVASPSSFVLNGTGGIDFSVTNTQITLAGYSAGDEADVHVTLQHAVWQRPSPYIVTGKLQVVA